MVGNGLIYLYFGRCGRLWCCKSLLGTLWYGAVDLYWGRCGRVYRCISLLGTYWWSSSLKMFTWDGELGNVAVDIHWGRCGRELNDIIFYWGRCGRVCLCRSLLGTLW